MKMQLPKVLVIALAAAALSGFSLAQEETNAGSTSAIQPPIAQSPGLPIAPPPPVQPPQPRVLPTPPDRMMPRSQETDPEVAIAEAQLREAEARLRQAKIEAAQRAIEGSHLQRIAELARKNAKEQEDRAKLGIGNQQERMEAQERLAQAEAAVAKLNAAAEIMKPAASLSSASPELSALHQPRIPAPRPELPTENKSEVVMALESAVSIEFEEATLRTVSEFISEYVQVNIVMDVGLRAADEPVSLRVEDVPLRDALLALADAYGDVCFVVRDYGIFATTAERAMTINAPTIPANIPLLVSIQEASASGIGSGGFGFGWSDGKGGGGAAGGFGGGGFGGGGGGGGLPPRGFGGGGFGAQGAPGGGESPGAVPSDAPAQDTGAPR